MQRELSKRVARIELLQKELSRPTIEQIRAAMEGYDSESDTFPPDTPESVKAEVLWALEMTQMIDGSVLGTFNPYPEVEQ